MNNSTTTIEGLLIWDEGKLCRPEVVHATLRENAPPIHDMVLEQTLSDIWREHGSVPVRVTIEVM